MNPVGDDVRRLRLNDVGAECVRTKSAHERNLGNIRPPLHEPCRRRREETLDKTPYAQTRIQQSLPMNGFVGPLSGVVSRIWKKLGFWCAGEFFGLMPS